MENSNRELDQVRSELNKLHERSSRNKTEISAHEAVCELRYEHISKSLDEMSAAITDLAKSVQDLQDLATQGKSSLSTLLWIGGAIAGITGYFLLVSDLFYK
jgi:hypothetical protein